jgi:hypothetical protein
MMLLMIGEDEDGVVFLFASLCSCFFFFLLFMKLLLFISMKDICREAHQKILKLKAKGDTNLYLFFFVCE